MPHRFGPALNLYFDPRSLSDIKALMALHEAGVPFRGEIVPTLDRYAGAAFLAMSPSGATPVLRDERQNRTICDSTVIIEYVGQQFASAASLLPAEEAHRHDVRLWDRIFELQVSTAMRALRPRHLAPDIHSNAQKVSMAREALRAAYNMVEQHLRGRTWMVGESLSLADCAAAAALFASGFVEPFSGTHPRLAAYFERLMQRQSFKRVLSDIQAWRPREVPRELEAVADHVPEAVGALTATAT